MNNIIYCDNASTTKPLPSVCKAISQVNQEIWGNPSSLHREGSKAKKILSSAKKIISEFLLCSPEEIFFTSGGTESNNLAILGSLNYFITEKKNKKLHFITSSIEHSSVYEIFKYIQGMGHEVDYLSVNSEGFINLYELQSLIKESTCLVSIIHANNEIGTLQDIQKISSICKEKNIRFHTDAVQSAGKVKINLNENIDLLSISGHKIYATKGIGVLYKNKNCNLSPINFGGGQELGLRSGTENIPAISGLIEAFKYISSETHEQNLKKLQILEQKIITEIKQNIPQLIINGTSNVNKKVAGLLSLSSSKLKGDFMVLQFNLNKICISSGSACSEGTIKPNRVIKAIYPNKLELALNTIRLSLGIYNTAEDCDKIIGVLKKIIL